jgi:hypothetical protein
VIVEIKKILLFTTSLELILVDAMQEIAPENEVKRMDNLENPLKEVGLIAFGQT